MPPPRQLEFFPQKGPSAEDRRAIIRKRLEGLEYRQQAREERRRLQQQRRKGRETGSGPAGQVTLEEIIERLREQGS